MNIPKWFMIGSRAALAGALAFGAIWLVPAVSVQAQTQTQTQTQNQVHTQVQTQAPPPAPTPGPDRRAVAAELENLFGEPGDSGDAPIRCLTPYIQLYEEVGDLLSPAAREAMAAMLEAPSVADLEPPYYSPSGRFRILYAAGGSDAVPLHDSSGTGIPDYVEWTAQYADFAFHVQVDSLGFVDPTVNHGSGECFNRRGSWQDTVITIHFENRGVYGGFRSSAPFEFFVHPNFEGFPPNSDPDGHVRGALKATIAHELKHVIQYAANCMRGDAGRGAWVEMDATMMENIVYPEVNDYYNYIILQASLFHRPEYSIPAYSRVNDSYSHVTWMLFYAERFGMDFWVEAWDQIGRYHYMPFISAMQIALQSRATDFETELIRNHLWHLASGSRSMGNGTPDQQGYGFSERLNYPDAVTVQTFGELPEGPWGETTVPLRAARYYEYGDVAMEETGPVALVFFNNQTGAGTGLLVRKTGGTLQEYIIPSGNQKMQKMRLPVDWEEVEWLGAVIVNSAVTDGLHHQFFAASGSGVERFTYGDVLGNGTPDMDDAQWILDYRLSPVPTSGFKRFVSDVTGDGSLSPYDASWIFRVLDSNGDDVITELAEAAPGPDLSAMHTSGSGSPQPSVFFPTDLNGNGLGPEWSRFAAVETLALWNAKSPHLSKKGGWKAPGWSPGVSRYPHRVDASVEKILADTLETTLDVLAPGGIPLPDEPLDLFLSVPGASDSLWHSFYLDLEVDYFTQPGGGGESPEIFFLDWFVPAKEQSVHGWAEEFAQNRLRLAYAGSRPIGSGQEYSDAVHDPDHMLRLRFQPVAEGYLHFRVAALELDEKKMGFRHQPMDTVRVMTGVTTEDPPDQPLAFRLYQNYPNPFNPQTNLAFTLPEPGPAKLELFDVTGRRVAVLHDGFLDKGHHTIRFDMQNHTGLASGIYLYRLDAGGLKAVKKMTLVR